MIEAVYIHRLLIEQTVEERDEALRYENHSNNFHVVFSQGLYRKVGC